MATLFDSASLVMIPSGVKEDKLYSIKPTDGSGDFTFSRDADIQATRVNASGLIEKARENLLEQSNSFDNAGWTKQNVVVSANSVQNPFNTGTTFTMTEQVGISQYRIYSTALHTTTSGTVYTHSVYIKRLSGTRDFAIIDVNGGARVYFNMTTISVGSEDVGKGKIEDVGNGWYRLSVYGVATGSGAFYLAMTNGTTTGSETYTSDGSGSFAIYAAQLNHGLIAQDYVETTTTAVVEGLTADLPRLDYSGGASCPSLLLEPSRTNLFIQSEYLNTSYSLNAGTTLTDNYAISPEGVQNATRYVGTGGSGFGRLYTLTNGTDYTISVYVKSNTGATQYCRLVGDSSNVSSDLEVTTEWTRIDYTWTSAGLASKTNGLFRDSSDNDIDILVYGMQLEAGSYPTSYIPTYGTAANRGADSCVKTGVSSLIGQTEGTIYAELNWKAQTGAEDLAIWMRTGATSYNEMIALFIGTNYKAQASVRSSSIQQVLLASDVLSDGVIKMAFAYSANDFAFYVNGVLVGTDTNGSVPTCDQVYLGGYPDGGTRRGKNNQTLLFKTRLTNAELAALTTI